MKKLLLILFISLGLTSTVYADKAYDLYQKGDYDAAAIEWTKKAKYGDKNAMFNLGLLYYKGKGVTKNDEQAVFWIKKSANKGYPSAQNRLGWHLYYGKGIAKNYNQAMDWWRKADEQGNISAKYWLGIGSYDVGEFRYASYMFYRAAQENDTDAQYMLGKMHERGEYTSKRYPSINTIENAKRWYTKASLSGNTKAKKALQRIDNEAKQKKAETLKQARLDKIAEDKRLAKIAEDKRLAKIAEEKRQAEFIETKKQLEIAKKNRQLRIDNQKKKGIKAYKEKNYDVASEELLPAAKSGDIEAQYLLGRIAADVNIDYKLALYWYEKVGNQGNIPIHWRIADIYSKGGNGVLKNPNKAMYSYTRLARNGDAKAQYKIGLIYLNGDGVEKSLEDASYWIEKSFQNDGNKDAEIIWNKYKLWNY
jgi:uncharacterized protein